MKKLYPIQVLITQYPMFIATRRFYQIVKVTGTLLDEPSRILLADILLYAAYGLDALLEANLTVFIAPQLVRVQELAQDCREFASTLKRYASLSQGTMALTLLRDAQGALQNPSTDTNSVLTLIYGVRFY